MIRSLRGFSLVEVLVALVLLEVGLLGVVGTLVAAQGMMREAEVQEAVLLQVWGILDSLEGGGTFVNGHQDAPRGLVEWHGGASGRLSLLWIRDGDTQRVDTWLALGTRP